AAGGHLHAAGRRAGRDRPPRRALPARRGRADRKAGPPGAGPRAHAAAAGPRAAAAPARALTPAPHSGWRGTLPGWARGRPANGIRLAAPRRGNTCAMTIHTGHPDRTLHVALNDDLAMPRLGFGVFQIPP